MRLSAWKRKKNKANYIMVYIYYHQVIKHRSFCGEYELQKELGFRFWEMVEVFLRPHMDKLEKVYMNKQFLGWRLNEDGKRYAKNLVEKIVYTPSRVGTRPVVRAMQSGS